MAPKYSSGSARAVPQGMEEFVKGQEKSCSQAAVDGPGKEHPLEDDLSIKGPGERPSLGESLG